MLLVPQDHLKQKNFYDLKVCKDGKLEYYYSGKKVSALDKILVGTISEELVMRAGNAVKILRHTQDINRSDHLRLQRLKGHYVPQAEQPIYYQNRLTSEQFRNIATRLTPFVNKDDSLFSINRDNGQTYFALEGKILEIQKQ